MTNWTTLLETSVERLRELQSRCLVLASLVLLISSDHKTVMQMRCRLFLGRYPSAAYAGSGTVPVH